MGKQKDQLTFFEPAAPMLDPGFVPPPDAPKTSNMLPTAADLQDSIADEAWPLARLSDPDTSHEAAQRIVASGVLRGQMASTYQAALDTPGKTSAELAKIHGLDRYAVARRLPVLKRRGLLTTGPTRQCQATGYNAMTWSAIDDGQGESRDPRKPR